MFAFVVCVGVCGCVPCVPCNWSYRWLWTSMWVLGTEPDLRQKQQVLLITELSLQSLLKNSFMSKNVGIGQNCWDSNNILKLLRFKLFYHLNPRGQNKGSVKVMGLSEFSHKCSEWKKQDPEVNVALWGSRKTMIAAPSEKSCGQLLCLVGLIGMKERHNIVNLFQSFKIKKSLIYW